MPIIFITGSGRRLGRGLALKFAAEGWDVAIHYFSSHEQGQKTYDEVKSYGVNSVLVSGDVRNKGEMKLAMETTIDKIGIPDVLVNNAGILPSRASLKDISSESWNEAIGINMTGMLITSQIYADYAQKGAHIINMASLGGIEVWKQRIPYNVSKAGAIHLSKALARELAPDITVNCVAPGMIMIPEEPAQSESSVNIKRIPMERFGSVNDIFCAVHFFAVCPSFITGQLIAVDGGQSLT